MDRPDPACPARRHVLLTSAGAVLLAGCSTYGDDADPPASSAAPAAPPAGTADGATGGATGGTADGAVGGATGGAAGRLAALGDVPVGGGRVLREAKVVVTRPSADVVRAFSAVCTHAGCTVGEVSGGTINCPCHGSRFAIADGSVVRGPARSPLASVPVRVSGDAVVRG